MLLLKRNGKVISDPLFQPERIELVKKTTKIGRSASHADVVMDSTVSPRMISRMHAQITRMDNQYFIQCTGMNGMLVNSVKKKKCLLRAGDVVVFGGAGVKTSEGSIISNLQSELVYVFQSLQKAVEDKKDCKGSRGASFHHKDTTPVVNVNKPSTGDLEDLDTKKYSMLNKRAASSTSRLSGVISDMTDQYSPGEGTSGGSVLRRTKKSFMMPFDSDDDDEYDKSGYSKLPLKHKVNSSEKGLYDEANNGIVFKRKKKRTALPFDSDDDSANSPVKKAHKIDASMGELEKRHTKEEKLQSEIKDNKNFLDDLNEELLCCICRELLVLTHALPCSHTFCYPCIRDWLRQAQDCPSCRAKAAFNHLVPVKVLDNTVDKVATRVLSPDHRKERQTRIQELQDKINGRMAEDTELRAEYGHVRSQKEYCEKCNLSISNRLLRWALSFPQTSSTGYYHFKCFKPARSVTMNQVKLASEVSKTDMKKISSLIRS